MSKTIWPKPCNVVILPKENDTYRLYHRDSRQSFDLKGEQAQAWFNGNLKRLDNLTSEIRSAGIDLETKEVMFVAHVFDNLRPSISLRWTRFYSESPELTILFNTQSMRKNNPLLVLGPYGSVVWNSIAKGASIGDIRHCVLDLFGVDEVLPFLVRLMHLGFLTPIKKIMNLPIVDQKIIKEFNAPEIQFMISHSRVPWYCLWEVTTNCDMRCQICYLQEYKNPGPQHYAWNKIIDQIDHAGVFYVTLLGGEALLRNDLEEIVSRLRGANIFVKLITNGLTLTSERAAALADAGLNHIEISFDGLTRTSHEISRPPNTYNKAKRSLHIAQKNGIPRVGMVLTLHSQSIADLPKLPSFMNENNIKECYLSLFRKTGLMGSQSTITPITMEKLSGVNRIVSSWQINYPDLNIALLPVCTCGRTSIVIGANMTLRPCPFSYDSAVGDLHNDTFVNLWQQIGEKTRAGILWCR